MTIQFDKIASAYNSSPIADHPVNEHLIYHTWLQICDLINGLKVLDLACSGGRSSRKLAQQGAQVIGIDNSIKMLEIAKIIEKNNPLEIKYLLADATKLPVFEKKFNLATMAFLFHYANSRKQLQSMAKGIAINLKPGSNIIGINNNPEHPVEMFLPNVRSSSEWIDNPFVEGSRLKIKLYSFEGEEVCTFIIYYWSKKVYEKILSESGFKQIEWIPFRFSQQGKKICLNWQELEKKTNLTIIKAKRR